MKTNITLKLDPALLREAKVIAAKKGTSIDAMLTERLEQIVRERKAHDYDQARHRALARLRHASHYRWTKPKSRDELHER